MIDFEQDPDLWYDDRRGETTELETPSVRKLLCQLTASEEDRLHDALRVISQAQLEASIVTAAYSIRAIMQHAKRREDHVRDLHAKIVRHYHNRCEA